MRMRSVLTWVVPAILLAGVSLAGCSKKSRMTFLPNERPVVRLTDAPVSPASRYFYAYHMNWVGYDPDGRVDHFQYAIDPPSVAGSETSWVSTTKNDQIVFFKASTPDSFDSEQASDFHVFVIRAVDNLGLNSAPVYRAFFSYTEAPTLSISAPHPSCLLDARVTPSVFITWNGQDPDGQFTQKPVRYMYKLFKDTNNEFSYNVAIQNPDSLRRYYAPNFVGWDTTSAETTQVRFNKLVPNSKYLFVVVAFDEAGAYSPVFSCNSNMLTMSVGFAGSLGPILTMYNQFFNYTYPSGGFSQDETRVVNLQIPAGIPVTYNWFGTPDVEGATVKQYRWAMDIADLDDETKRTNEETDVTHWSQWSLATTTATVGPFAGLTDSTGKTESHRFYIEAEDINGLLSLGVIAFEVIKPTFDKELLIVDDTRLLADQLFSSPYPTHPDSIVPPPGGWPSAAELDTFLYARGGVRWRMTPDGTLSPVGVFAGYGYDTLGTRNGKEDPTVPLSLLGRYRHVIWMTDFVSASNLGGPTDPRFPMSTLRYMSAPGRQNTLSTWVSQGGKLWALGGGVAYATNIDYNNRLNDVGITAFNSTGQRPDLVPGRFMYDVAKWQSEVRSLGGVTVQFQKSTRAVGGWTGAPDYNLLPTVLSAKTPSTDPIYPFRTFSTFYLNKFTFEFMDVPNYIQEDSDPDPARVVPVSTLDTLFVATGSSVFLQPEPKFGVRIANPTMTYYHGALEPPMVFTGFDIWHYRRAQIIQLVDFVMQQIWGLPRQAIDRNAAVPVSAAVR